MATDQIARGLTKINSIKYGSVGISSVTMNATNDGFLFNLADGNTYEIPLSSLAFLLKTNLSDSITLNDSQIPSSSKATYLLNQALQSMQTNVETNYVKNDKLTSNINGDSETLVATQKAINELKKIITLVALGMVYIGGVSSADFVLMNFGTSGNIYKALNQIVIGVVTIPENALIILKNTFENRLITENDFDYFVGNESLHNILDELQGGDSENNHYYHSDQPINKTDTVTFATVNATTATIPTMTSTTGNITTVTSTTGNITTINSTNANFGSIKAGADAPIIKMKKLTGTLNSVGAYTDINHGLDVTKILSFTAIAYNTDNRWVAMDTFYDADSKFSCSALGTLFRIRNDGSKLVGRQIKIMVTYEV